MRGAVAGVARAVPTLARRFARHDRSVSTRASSAPRAWSTTRASSARSSNRHHHHHQHHHDRRGAHGASAARVSDDERDVSMSASSSSSSSSSSSAFEVNPEKHLILVDGLSFIFRAYYGWNSRGGGEGLMNAAGENTSVLYSYAHTICSLLEMAPSHLAVCMDAKGKTFRHEMFVEYKANRPPTPEPLLELIPKVEQLVRDMGVPLLRLSGVEADDIIGTVGRRASDEGFSVSICSPDKDFYQLLGSRTRMLKPSKSNKGDPFEAFTVDDFRVMHNNVIEPKQFIDFLALVGDSSDNIPGVEGVGPKTALALLEEYGDIDAALANAEKVKGKRARESLSSEKGAASAALSRRLVEIRQNLTVPSLNEPLLPLESLRVRRPVDGGAAAARAFEHYELETVHERWRRVVRL